MKNVADHEIEEDRNQVPRLVRYGVPLAFEELSDGYQALLVICLDSGEVPRLAGVRGTRAGFRSARLGLAGEEGRHQGLRTRSVSADEEQAPLPGWLGPCQAEAGQDVSEECAYCESRIHRRRSGQVEHFRPKSLFPSFAYDWDNYFLSCGGCNGMKLSKWREDHPYLRPDQDEGSHFLHFSRDGSVRPRQNGDEGERASGTSEDWGLDKDRQREARKDGILEDFADDGLCGFRRRAFLRHVGQGYR